MNHISRHKCRVLFLCTGNSARSQMAEAVLRHVAGEQFEVCSAGTSPEAIDKRTISALKKFEINTNNLQSKHVNQYREQHFDYVISLCDKAALECRNYEGGKNHLAWDFPDPKTRKETNAFTTTLQEINNRITMFMLLEPTVVPTVKTNKNITDNGQTECKNKSLEINPTDFYKCLTDDIRLATVMLTNYFGEICVSELMTALEEPSQPKVSRNLAVLKKAQLLTDRKVGQWVFYRINPQLPQWSKTVISQTTENNIPLISKYIKRLANMENRPRKSL